MTLLCVVILMLAIQRHPGELFPPGSSCNKVSAFPFAWNNVSSVSPTSLPPPSLLRLQETFYVMVVNWVLMFNGLTDGMPLLQHFSAHSTICHLASSKFATRSSLFRAHRNGILGTVGKMRERKRDKPS
ncbi:hypothetical protein CHARACLAT_014433, partial [Characodon lateralis]|nr:hypothetical protein [Characodon lateralis]